MSRALKIPAVGLALLGLVYGGLSIDWRDDDPGSVTLEAEESLQGPLTAGAATGELMPSHPVPLGGFARRDGASWDGIRDVPMVRAVVLGDSAPRLAIVTVDLVLIPPPLHAAVEAKVGFPVLLAATHTHNGPGALWDNALAEFGGFGTFDAAWFEEAVNLIVDTIGKAQAPRVPVTLSSGVQAAPGVCAPRVKGRTTDDRVSVFVLTPTGAEAEAPLARLLVFGCHPTLLGYQDHRLSAGWPGVTAAALGPAPTLVLQGAVGDVGPPRGKDGTPEARMVALGEAVAAGARTAPLTPAGEATIRWRRARLELPAPTGRFIAPTGLKTPLSNLVAWVGPETASLTRLELGPVPLLFVPGEPVTPLVRTWTETHHLGRIVSLTNAYLGYLETPEALEDGTGEARRAYFDEPAVRLVDAAIGQLAGP